MAAYGDDLAYIHDQGHGSFARESAAGLLDILRAGEVRGTVVDVGCGSGIWAERLVQAGYRVVGVDISPSMIDLAGVRVPAAEFHISSFLDFELPRCAAITAIGEVLGYLFHASKGEVALSAFCRRAFQALLPGGLLIFDVAEVGLDRNRPAVFYEGDGWSCAVRFDYDAATDRLTRRIVTFRQVGDLYRRSEESHTLQLFAAAAIERLLADCGFTVQTVRSYGDCALLPGRVGFVARKE